MQGKTEISSSVSSSRFYTVELNSIFGLSIKTSLPEENLNSSAPNCRFYTVELRLKKSRLSSSGVKLVFSIKTANIIRP